MLFNSWSYLFFLAAAVGIHWSLPHRWRTLFLAAMSILFYCMWRWEFSLLMIFSACVDFTVARRIYASEQQSIRRIWLLISLGINLGLLVIFKYTYFIYDNIRIIGVAAGADMPMSDDLALRIILPLGISFYTFQTISYTIDVYRRVIEPTHNFSVFLTYVTFWPQLIAGPILRASEVIPQIVLPRRLTLDGFNVGVMLIVIGLFKKVVLADSLAVPVDAAFAFDPSLLNAFDVWVASFLFGFQIYFDFSGYSDIAIGSARLLGFRFPDNFNWPYMATSPRDFWKRWHISLSSWIRDYLYLPLTGQQFQTHSTGGISVATDSSRDNRTKALFLAWFIMGLWHGAGWNFALWGMYHAVWITLYRLIKPLQLLEQRVPVIAWGMTLALGMLAWIPFRAQSLSQTIDLYKIVLDPSFYTLKQRALEHGSYPIATALLLGMILLYSWRWVGRNIQLPTWLTVSTTTASISVMAILIITYLRPIRQFIYFQF